MIDLDRQTALHEAIEALYFAYRGFTDQADRILERRGLGRVHHRILYFIGRRPDVSVQGLLDVLAVSKQALNAPLRQLVGMDLVSALPSPRDRRVKNLRLTAEGKKLETATNGRISIQMFPSMQLGGEKEMIEQAQVGALQIARISVGAMGPVVDDLNVFNLPFVFRDEAHMRKVIDGPIGTELLDRMSNAPGSRLIALGWMDAGTRNVYAKKAVSAPGPSHITA